MSENIEQEKQNTQVVKITPLSELKAVKSESVDVKEFDGTRVQIEKAEIVQVQSHFSETGKQWVLKVVSVPLKELEREGGEKIQFTASELFNLVQDEKGVLIGYPEAENSNLMKFMKKIGAKKPDEIIGKTALISSYEAKNGRTYLKFVY